MSCPKPFFLGHLFVNKRSINKFLFYEGEFGGGTRIHAQIIPGYLRGTVYLATGMATSPELDSRGGL